MSRTLAGLDRLLALLLGLILLAVGVGAIIWQGGWYHRAPRTLSVPWLSSATTASWWPWATGIGGIILILAALRWLVAHLPHRRSPAVTLAGSDRTGQLTADLSALAAASATVLADTPGVRSTSGTAITDRGQPTLRLTATLEPTADLATVTTAADRIGTQLATALPDPDVAAQVHLRVARSARNQPRVS